MTCFPLEKGVLVRTTGCVHLCDLRHGPGEPSVTSRIPFGVSRNTALTSDVLNDCGFVQ